MLSEKAISEIRSEVALRGIQFLVHFTQLQNLPSIVTHGFLSRAELASRRLGASPSDHHRLDCENGACSFSVSAINWEMFQAKQNTIGKTHWVVLVLDSSILWTRRCHFHWRNAARSDMRSHRGRIDGPWALRRMFSDDNPPARFTGHHYRLETGIADDLPTYADAEVQVFDPVAPDLIVGAWVNRNDVAEAVKRELARLPGEAREIVVRDFLPRFGNGIEVWG